MFYYEVAPLRIVRTGSTMLTYASAEAVAPGTIIRVSIGQSHALAVVWKKVAKPHYETKPIAAIIDPIPLPKALLQTAIWMADYYSVHLATVLQTMLPSGLEKQRRLSKTSASNPVRERTNYVLNTEQQQALEAIQRAQKETVLLHGITGSGKTAVYIELARSLLTAGKSVIVLTPEISLTPQLVAEFTSHFTNVIATHSQMTESARHQAWQTILHADEPHIIIGPRSALFMPVQNLGAIIIDECHEPSYKQEQQPRYQAARAARIIATAAGAHLVLGSATPNISDFYIAQQSGLVVGLTKRAKALHVPTVTIIDATKRPYFSRNPILATPLIEAMQSHLSQGRQALLFHNRRGTAGSTLCQQCGWHAECDTCHLTLTLHADSGQLRCHLCGFTGPIPPNCPICHKADVVFRGIGTKRIENEVAKLFPRARVGRFDADAEKGQQLHDQYQALYDGDVDIIIGTQLLAKGLDLPKLGIVGIVQADTGLLMPDYSARERTFQLIAQAAGRVGRQDHATEVFVQTYRPDEAAIICGTHESYQAFYADEIIQRQRGHYPPFSYLLKAICSYKTEAAAVRGSRMVAAKIKADHPDAIVIGPTPAFYERLRGVYRWQVTVRSPRRQLLQTIAREIPTNWHVELDPHSLLS